MIEIAKLSQESKQREVVYTAAHGDKEYGRITSWNDHFIFVRYHLRVQPDGGRHVCAGTTSEATSPADLEWA